MRQLWPPRPIVSSRRYQRFFLRKPWHITFNPPVTWYDRSVANEWING